MQFTLSQPGTVPLGGGAMLDPNAVTLGPPEGDEGEGIWVTLDDGGPDEPDGGSDHDQNLAEIIPEGTLAAIASDLLDDIANDERSRSEWMNLREQALGLLGLKINPPKTDPGGNGAPLEGMSSYQDSALLEASIRFQANARGELLPAGGPVKVQNEGAPTGQNEDEAEALEKACNRFLTVTSTEYVPETDRLFFQTGWSGIGFKKGFHCPIRRRPVIESVDAKDLIVADTATDIDNAARVTHAIKMSRTVLIRMQIAGAYRVVDLASPVKETNVVEERIGSIQGIRVSQTNKPENMDRLIYECYCDLDIPGFEHTLKGRLTGLPIPYRVTIDKSSRQILEIRRNWKEGDEQCMKRKTFVAYQFIPYMGFYPLGLMHILGNTTNIITAAMRILIDAGMFGNFQSWIYAKTGQGQDKTDFRAAPGTGIPLNVGPGEKLGDKIMPMPTKPIDPSFIQFVENVRTTAARLGGTAEIQVGEGNQQAPVGTTIALIEQAQKVLSAVHKRFYQTQSEEFRMLQDLLREDPEALWRDIGKGQPPYNADVIRAALENFDLVPQADPNVPSHMVRMTKAEAVKQTVMAAPQYHDIKSCLEWYYDQIGVPDAKRFIVVPPPQQQQPQQLDPSAVRQQIANQDLQFKAASDAQDRQFKTIELQSKMQDAAADRAARQEEKKLDLARELVIHASTPEVAGMLQNPGLTSGLVP